jgi:hypothetical protein
MIFYKIIQHVHHNLGKEPVSSWYNSTNTLKEATAMVRELNARNSAAIDDPERIAVTYSISF